MHCICRATLIQINVEWISPRHSVKSEVGHGSCNLNVRSESEIWAGVFQPRSYLCMLAALFMPLRLAHSWVNLLTDAAIHSSRVWVEGLIWSVVLGWLTAIIFGTIYNWIVARRAVQEIA